MKRSKNSNQTWAILYVVVNFSPLSSSVSWASRPGCFLSIPEHLESRLHNDKHSIIFFFISIKLNQVFYCAAPLPMITTTLPDKNQLLLRKKADSKQYCRKLSYIPLITCLNNRWFGKKKKSLHVLLMFQDFVQCKSHISKYKLVFELF